MESFRQQKSDQLLRSIKENLPEIEKLHRIVLMLEEDCVYRFYHYSFKVFGAIDAIKDSVELFERIALEGLSLNRMFQGIASEAMSKSFDEQKTNANWVNETRPILEALWHVKYFLEQMLLFGSELEESPQLLPSGWAAVLYLYNTR